MKRRGFFHWVGILAVVALAAWGVVRVVYAAQGPSDGRGAWGGRGMGLHAGFGGERGRGPLGRLVRANVGRLITLGAELNITDEQREQLKAIVHAHRDETAQVVQKLVEKKQALREAVMAQPADEDAIRAASNDLGKAVGDAAVLGSKIIAEARGVLTPEQLELIEQFLAEHDKSVNEFLAAKAAD